MSYSDFKAIIRDIPLDTNLGTTSLIPHLKNRWIHYPFVPFLITTTSSEQGLLSKINQSFVRSDSSMNTWRKKVIKTLESIEAQHALNPQEQSLISRTLEELHESLDMSPLFPKELITPPLVQKQDPIFLEKQRVLYQRSCLKNPFLNDQRGLSWDQLPFQLKDTKFLEEALAFITSILNTEVTIPITILTSPLGNEQQVHQKLEHYQSHLTRYLNIEKEMQDNKARLSLIIYSENSIETKRALFLEFCSSIKNKLELLEIDQEYLMSIELSKGTGNLVKSLSSFLIGTQSPQVIEEKSTIEKTINQIESVFYQILEGITQFGFSESILHLLIYGTESNEYHNQLSYLASFFNAIFPDIIRQGILKSFKHSIPIDIPDSMISLISKETTRIGFKKTFEKILKPFLENEIELYFDRVSQEFLLKTLETTPLAFEILQELHFEAGLGKTYLKIKKQAGHLFHVEIFSYGLGQKFSHKEYCIPEKDISIDFIYHFFRFEFESKTNPETSFSKDHFIQGFLNHLSEYELKTELKPLKHPILNSLELFKTQIPAQQLSQNDIKYIHFFYEVFSLIAFLQQSHYKIPHKESQVLTQLSSYQKRLEFFSHEKILPHELYLNIWSTIETAKNEVSSNYHPHKINYSKIPLPFYYSRLLVFCIEELNLSSQDLSLLKTCLKSAFENTCSPSLIDSILDNTIQELSKKPTEKKILPNISHYTLSEIYSVASQLIKQQLPIIFYTAACFALNVLKNQNVSLSGLMVCCLEGLLVHYHQEILEFILPEEIFKTYQVIYHKVLETFLSIVIKSTVYFFLDKHALEHWWQTQQELIQNNINPPKLFDAHQIKSEIDNVLETRLTTKENASQHLSGLKEKLKTSFKSSTFFRKQDLGLVDDHLIDIPSSFQKTLDNETSILQVLVDLKRFYDNNRSSIRQRSEDDTKKHFLIISNSILERLPVPTQSCECFWKSFQNKERVLELLNETISQLANSYLCVAESESTIHLRTQTLISIYHCLAIIHSLAQQELEVESHQLNINTTYFINFINHKSNLQTSPRLNKNLEEIILYFRKQDDVTSQPLFYYESLENKELNIKEFTQSQEGQLYELFLKRNPQISSLISKKWESTQDYAFLKERLELVESSLSLCDEPEDIFNLSPRDYFKIYHLLQQTLTSNNLLLPTPFLILKEAFLKTSVCTKKGFPNDLTSVFSAKNDQYFKTNIQYSSYVAIKHLVKKVIHFIPFVDAYMEQDTDEEKHNEMIVHSSYKEVESISNPSSKVIDQSKTPWRSPHFHGLTHSEEEIINNRYRLFDDSSFKRVLHGSSFEDLQLLKTIEFYFNRVSSLNSSQIFNSFEILFNRLLLFKTSKETLPKTQEFLETFFKNNFNQFVSLRTPKIIARAMYACYLSKCYFLSSEEFLSIDQMLSITSSNPEIDLFDQHFIHLHIINYEEHYKQTSLHDLGRLYFYVLHASFTRTLDYEIESEKIVLKHLPDLLFWLGTHHEEAQMITFEYFSHYMGIQFEEGSYVEFSNQNITIRNSQDHEITSFSLWTVPHYFKKIIAVAKKDIEEQFFKHPSDNNLIYLLSWNQGNFHIKYQALEFEFQKYETLSSTSYIPKKTLFKQQQIFIVSKSQISETNLNSLITFCYDSRLPNQQDVFEFWKPYFFTIDSQDEPEILSIFNHEGESVLSTKISSLSSFIDRQLYKQQPQLTIKSSELDNPDLITKIKEFFPLEYVDIVSEYGKIFLKIQNSYFSIREENGIVRIYSQDNPLFWIQETQFSPKISLSHSLILRDSQGNKKIFFNIKTALEAFSYVFSYSRFSLGCHGEKIIEDCLNNFFESFFQNKIPLSYSLFIDIDKYDNFEPKDISQSMFCFAYYAFQQDFSKAKKSSLLFESLIYHNPTDKNLGTFIWILIPLLFLESHQKIHYDILKIIALHQHNSSLHYNNDDAHASSTIKKISLWLLLYYINSSQIAFDTLSELEQSYLISSIENEIHNILYATKVIPKTVLKTLCYSFFSLPLLEKILKNEEKKGFQNAFETKLILASIKTIKYGSGENSYLNHLERQLLPTTSTIYPTLAKKGIEVSNYLISRQKKLPQKDLTSSFLENFSPSTLLTTLEGLHLNCADNFPPLSIHNFNEEHLKTRFFDYWRIAHLEIPPSLQTPLLTDIFKNKQKKLRTLLDRLQGKYAQQTQFLIQILKSCLNYPLLFPSIEGDILYPFKKKENLESLSLIPILSYIEYCDSLGMGENEILNELCYDFILKCSSQNRVNFVTQSQTAITSTVKSIVSFLGYSSLELLKFSWKNPVYYSIKTAQFSQNALKIKWKTFDPSLQVTPSGLEAPPLTEELEDHLTNIETFLNTISSEILSDFFNTSYYPNQFYQQESIPDSILETPEHVSIKIKKIQESLLDFYNRETPFISKYELKTISSIPFLEKKLLKYFLKSKNLVASKKQELIDTVNYLTSYKFIFNEIPDLNPKRFTHLFSFEELYGLFLKNSLKEYASYGFSYENKLSFEKSMYEILIISTFSQKLEKALNILKELNTHYETLEEAQREEIIHKLGSQIIEKRVYSFRDENSLLLKLNLAFEERSGMMLWEKQYNQLRNLILSRRLVNTVEAIMGIGKTSYMLLVANAFKARKKLVITSYPQTVAKTNTSETASRGGKFLFHKTFSFTITRSTFKTNSQLEAFYSSLCQQIFHAGSCSLTQSDLQSLELNFITLLWNFAHTPFSERFFSETPAKAKSYAMILNLLKTKGHLNIDEIQIASDPKKEKNFPLGEKKFLDSNIIKTVYLIMDCCLTHSELSPKLKLIENKQASLDPEFIKDTVLTPLAKLLSKHPYFNVDESQQSEISSYLLGELSYVPSYMHKISHQKRESLSVAKGLLSSILPSCFNSISNVDSGLKKQQTNYHKEEFAIVYDGSNNPVKNTIIFNPLEALVKTYMVYATQTLNDEQVVDLLYAFQKQGIQEKPGVWNESNIYKKVQRYWNLELPEPKAYSSITENNLTHFIHKNKTKIDFFRHSLKAKSFYVLYIVSQQIFYFPQGAKSNAINYFSMFNSIDNYTGTPYNEGTYPQDNITIYDPGTVGESLDFMIKVGKKKENLRILEADSPYKILEEIFFTFMQKDPLFLSFIDAGASQRGRSSEDMAQQLMELCITYRPDIEGIVYYNQEGSKECLLKEALSTIPFEECSLKEHQRLTIFDHPKTVGADIPQAFYAKGVITIGEKTFLESGFLQAMWRLRGLKKKFQSFTIVIPRYIASKIFQSTDDPSIEELIKFLILNEEDSLLDKNFKSDVNKLLNAFRRFGLSKIIEFILHNEFKKGIEIFKQLESLFIYEQSDSFFDTYGQIDSWDTNPHDLFQKIKEQHITLFRKLSWIHPEELATLLKDIDLIQGPYPYRKKIHSVIHENQSKQKYELSNLGQSLEVSTSAEKDVDQNQEINLSQELQQDAQIFNEDLIDPSFFLLPPISWQPFLSIDDLKVVPTTSLSRIKKDWSSILYISSPLPWGRPIYQFKTLLQSEYSLECFKCFTPLLYDNIFICNAMAQLVGGAQSQILFGSKQRYFDYIMYIESEGKNSYIFTDTSSLLFWKKKLEIKESTDVVVSFYSIQMKKIIISNSDLQTQNEHQLSYFSILGRLFNGECSFREHEIPELKACIQKGNYRDIKTAFLKIHSLKKESPFSGSCLETVFNMIAQEEDSLENTDCFL